VSRTRLAPDRLAQVLEGVGAAIDEMGGSFTMEYATVVVTAERKALPAPVITARAPR
jgi:hypothetical protein